MIPFVLFHVRQGGESFTAEGAFKRFFTGVSPHVYFKVFFPTEISRAHVTHEFFRPTVYGSMSVHFPARSEFGPAHIAGKVFLVVVPDFMDF